MIRESRPVIHYAHRVQIVRSTVDCGSPAAAFQSQPCWRKGRWSDFIVEGFASAVASLRGVVLGTFTAAGLPSESGSRLPQSKVLRTLAVLLVAVAMAGMTHAQVSYTGGAYSQNFDTLQGTTNNTTGVGWTDNVTLPGWYASLTTYGVTNGTMGGTAATFDGTTVAANVGLLSFGTAASTDRALGSRATSSVAGMINIYYGVRLVNNTAQTITSFSVMFTGEQWHKNGATTAHTLPLQYRLAATSITDAGTWTPVATFTSPVNTATIASLDGNTAANRRGVAGKVTGISWAPGAELWVRVADGNETGNEQAMGIDDFYFVADDESGLFVNGNSSYVATGVGAAAAALNASSFTVECRFIRTGPGVVASTGTGGVTTALPLVAKGVGEADGTNVDVNYFLGIDNVTGKLVADFEQLNATVDPVGSVARPAGQNFPVFGSTILQTGVFYHVAATYDSATATWKLYVNGVAETTTQTLPTFVGVTPRNDNIQGLGIGTTVNSTGARAGFFHGVIDEARVWNYARSESDILANKDVEIAAAPGLLGRYGLDEATGTTAAGTNAAGGAAPVGTLGGTVLPVWVNAKSLVPNIAPTVSITAPANNASIMAPATVSITATAADTDGSIAKVEFFNGATKLGEDTTAPYQYDWSRTNADTGTFSLTAKATDNGGAVTTSAVVSVTITPNSNQPPTVALSSPANNATGIGSSVSVTASLSDAESDPLTVTFYGRKTSPVAPGPDFTIATLPDTQFYSENLANNGRAATFHGQTQWLVDNRDTLNLAFVSHMGDIVQNGDAVSAEWTVADESMKRIENQVATLRAYGIPWGAAPGNHDQTSIGNAGGANVFYNNLFGASRYAGRSYWGGNQSPTNNNNNYQLFSASGLDFIILHLEYDARAVSSYQVILDWADAVMKANPNRRAIVTSHWIVNTGNPATFSTQGQALYDNLKDNPNFFLMLCGHVAGEGQRSDTFEGRTVHSVLQDYQGRTNGGDGWLRYFVFSPANNTISAKTYRVSNPVNPAAGAFETDTDSQFSLAYNMQTAVMAWVPLGTVNVSAGGTSASLNWTGLEAGSDYEWYASATDGVTPVNSSTRRFSTTANVAPTVAITAPANNAAFTAPAAFTLTADANDTDGTVSKVEFYQGATKLGEDTTAPYSQSVSGLLVGSYTFSAVVVDNSGASTLSSIINVTVNASTPPTVSITAPANNATFDAPATINIAADATDTDGTVSKVEFFNGATKLGEDTTEPFAYSWTGVISGIYSLTAKATDNANTIGTSSAISITVTNTDNVPPTVAITSPANNSSVSPGVPLTLSATASDTDGTVGKVEFFDGATLLGEDTTAPYAFTIPSLANGAHTFTAKATDNDAGTTTSSIVNVLGDPALWAYTETFDSMAGGTAPPSGWAFYGVFGGANSTYTDSIAIPASAVGGGTLNNTLTAATTFTTSSNTAGFNYALATSTSDRALGTSPTTGQFLALQLSLTNPTGAAINAIRLGYDTRRFTAVATANELPGYAPFYSLDNGTTWNAIPALVPTIATVPNTVGVTTAPPTTISLASPWANGATLLVRWIDDNAVATSPDQIIGLDNVSIALPVGQPPTVALTAPANGSVSYVGDTINLTANAADTDGTITKVEFYNGATKLGEDTTAPYEYAWSGFAIGSYSLTARATDSDLNTTTSSVIAVTVNAAPGSGTLTRGPYLNSNNQNSIIIRWRTSQAVAGRVMHGTSVGSLTSVANESTAQTDHVVQLTGLTPYTRYYYSVGSAFDTIAGGDAEHTFRTSPTPGTATNTRIWVVGDCGQATQFQRDVRDAYYAWTGARDPDLCLMLGDNAYNSGTDAEYTAGFYNIYPTMFRKMPLWSCLGNHDANNGTTTPTANFPYFDMFTFPTAGECGGVASGTEHYFSWDYGNIHFINLDSQTTLATSAANAPQTVWLQNDLASNTKTWTIALFHHPAYTKGSHDSDTEGQLITMRQVYAPILEAGGVDMVLTGHSHCYERSMLVDGHYGLSGTLTPAMKLNNGSGRPSGTGAYYKPRTGNFSHAGTVHCVAGSAGQASGGLLNHPVMFVSYNTGGTLNLDINGNRLDATYVEKGATVGTFTTPDTFTMIKQGGVIDSDGDGLSNAFENANGLNRANPADATPALVQSFMLGTTPGSGQAYNFTATPAPVTGNMVVSFPTQAGLTYQVFFSTDLLTWLPASSTVVGTGSAMNWTDDGTATGTPPSAEVKRFYKVSISN